MRSSCCWRDRPRHCPAPCGAAPCLFRGVLSRPSVLPAIPCARAARGPSLAWLASGRRGIPLEFRQVDLLGHIVVMEFYGGDGAFDNRVGYHAYEGLTDAFDERPRTAANLAKNRALILENHGVLTVGKTLRESFV